MIPASFGHAPKREIVTRAQVVQITIARTPTPRPHDRPDLLANVRVARVERRLLLIAPGRLGQRRAGAHREPARAELARVANAKPVWDIAPSAVKTGGLAVQTGNDVSTTGSGTGSAKQGDGAGNSSGGEPCGFVTFSDPHGSRFDPQTRGFWVDIRMSVHFSDGSSQSLILDYPWYYPSETANPWSDQNLKDPKFPTRFQPPPATKRSAEPPLVAFVIAHSTPEGLTLLNDCPARSPAASPAPGTLDFEFDLF